MASNTLLTCQTGTIETQSKVGCADVQNGGIGDDNYFDMEFADVDGDAGDVRLLERQPDRPRRRRPSSSRASTGAPRSTRARRCRCSATRRQPRTGLPAANPPAAASAWLKGPGGGGYVPVNASVFDTYTEDLGCPPGGVDERTRYQGFADVTSLVKAAGGGTTRSRTSRPARAPTATRAGRSWWPTRTSRSPPATSRSSTASARSRSTPTCRSPSAGSRPR